jgi:hypothetical protein
MKVLARLLKVEAGADMDDILSRISAIVFRIENHPKPGVIDI